MTRMFSVLATLAMMAFVAAPATSQTLYLHGGAGFPSSSGFNDAYKAGFNASAGLGYEINSILEGMVQGTVDRFENDLVGVRNFSAWSATGNLKLNGPEFGSRFTPYALGGAGIYRLGVQDNFETEFGLRVGAGLAVQTTPRTHLLLEPNYVLVLNEGDNTQYVPVRLGAAIGF
jgi:hypothetical protein